MVLLLCCNAAAESRFVDIAQSAGIDFVHRSGATGARYLPETYGSGAAFLDFDGDGALDLYLVNSGRLPQLSNEPEAANALFRNEGSGRFSEQTVRAGVGDRGYGMGAAVGDYDNDGWADLYVTNFGPNLLFHNRGEGRFADVTATADVGCPGWGTSAAFADVDLDGDLDLFVGNYLDYPTEEPLVCRIGNSEERLYCDPRKFDGQVDRLYINEGRAGGWAFADRTAAFGLVSVAGKELGVVFGDYDQDGDLDLYLANDLVPNMLYRNDGTRFVNRGLASGTSLNGAGVAEAGMGVDMADADGDGDLDLFVTNFQ
ncbi:MAG: VCBS repeat-containing protein [Gemmatimonadetes bacterium]|nr:VCBS repeat-containing protein [Gemmatimonadota bacterium]